MADVGGGAPIRLAPVTVMSRAVGSERARPMPLPSACAASSRADCGRDGLTASTRLAGSGSGRFGGFWNNAIVRALSKSAPANGLRPRARHGAPRPALFRAYPGEIMQPSWRDGKSAFRPPPRRRAATQHVGSALGEIFRREIPVDELVDHGVDVIGAAVLVIEVVGMFPYVDRQQCRLPLAERILGVRGFHELQLAAFGDQPSPSRAELGDAGLCKIGLELVVAAEIAVDHLRDLAGGPAARARLQAIPVERVVPHLRGVVEDAGLVGLAGGVLDDLLERGALEFGARDQFVEVVDVGLVMLAVVEAQRVR